MNLSELKEQVDKEYENDDDVVIKGIEKGSAGKRLKLYAFVDRKDEEEEFANNLVDFIEREGGNAMITCYIDESPGIPAYEIIAKTN